MDTITLDTGNAVKRCTKCGEEKPFEAFGKHRGGLYPQCKPCKNAGNRAYNATDKGKASMGRGYQKVKEQIAAGFDYNKEWRESDHGKAIISAWETSEKGQASRARSVEARKRKRQKRTDYEAAHPEVREARLEGLRALESTQDAKARKKVYADRYRKSDKGKISGSAQVKRHRAKKLNALGAHTAAEWAAEKALWDGLCAMGLLFGVCCNGEGLPITEGHILPLEAVEQSSNYITNIMPQCRAGNSAQSDALISEYLKRNGYEWDGPAWWPMMQITLQRNLRNMPNRVRLWK